MAIELVVEPGKVYSCKEFYHLKPVFSLALDGLVEARTHIKITKQGPYAVIDHHLADDDSPATGLQIYRRIPAGFFAPFLKKGLFNGTLFASHPDEDVCLSVFLLQKFHELFSYDQVRLNALVEAEDILDRSAGMEKIDDSLEGHLAWIFQPYHDVRFQQKLPKLNNTEMQELIFSVCQRIDDYLQCKGETISFSGQYEVIDAVLGYSLVQETGPDARRAMQKQNVTAFISYLGRTNGFHMYSAWRHPQSSAHPFSDVCNALNDFEGISPHNKNKWGCVTNHLGDRGGSPRLTGSKLNPSQLISFLRTFAQYL